MKISVEYEVDKIPLSNRMMFVSLIKKAVFNYDENLYKHLYKYGNDRKNKHTKDFTFSTYKENYKIDVKNSQIKLNSVILNVSSPNRSLILQMYNSFLRLDKYTYKNKYTLKKKKIKIIHHSIIKNNYALLKTMSPIVIKNKYGYFLDITDKEYVKSLNYIANKVLFNYRGYGLQRTLEFTPVDMKKVVVKEHIENFCEITGKKEFCINAFKGVFILKGDTTDLNDIYMLGLGFRRNQGFGMLDIA